MRNPMGRLVSAAAMAGLLLLSACGQKSGGVTSDDMVLGKADAPVTVIEYASVTCSHCARFNEEVFPAFKAKYVDTGQVKYVFREFLTAPPEIAAAGFLIARCAGPDKYFGVIDALFHSQNDMFQSGDARGTLFKVGQSTGMTNEQITACISDEKAIADMQKRMDKAVNEEKIAATPSFIIGGKKYEGEQTMAQLDAAVAAAQKK